jgi:transcriptional regulator with XRE-family HTH domain
MDIKAVVGRNVKQHRETKGLSQEQLAVEADLHRIYVSGI